MCEIEMVENEEDLISRRWQEKSQKDDSWDRLADSRNPAYSDCRSPIISRLYDVDTPTYCYSQLSGAGAAPLSDGSRVQIFSGGGASSSSMNASGGGPPRWTQTPRRVIDRRQYRLRHGSVGGPPPLRLDRMFSH